MASGNAALKEQALAILQAGRREISAEAKWLRHELNPKHAAERITRDHTGMVLLAAFGVGLLVPLLLIPKKKSHYEELVHELTAAQKKQLKKAEKPKVGAGAYLAGLVMKAASPILMKQGMRLWDQFQKSKLSPDARPARYA
ncbi:hypothetical protein DES53_101431 [Roseimicrobium gellanilyticum]|uniref:Uncharacterized protein n=1 Tax=Roseimicrobium gellanilyticum TaxID=748857 RepID=A0A366HVP2_9BACT|nr:hypothetical protein [Roseimicrobium gellanilyticum]RBP47634.1 hypothetical protein DES53_101431 [Roseimicrobium gellanilyticum]